MLTTTPSKLALAMLMAFGAGTANAELLRVGPTSAINGYPQWYQDKSGLALEFCAPTNAAELAGGHCLLLTGDTVAPEVFPDPTRFADEHFFYAADAGMTAANGGKVLLVLAVEGAFANGAVVSGDQQVFSRIRLRLNDVPMTGTYRFIHPYGEEVLEGVAGERIFATNDVGIECPPGQFDCAMRSRLGPFLLPSAVPGGAEQPAVAGPVPGKLYIADPGRSGPVTGSTLPPFTDSQGNVRDHNIFRVEGPPGSNLGGPGIDFVETTNFSLMGRIFQGTIPGRVTADRASYERSGEDPAHQKVDVFATGLPTTQGRLPTQPTPNAIQPSLSFFSAPCVENEVGGEVVLSAPSGAETVLANSGTRYWGRSAGAAVPLNGVCIKDNNARDVNGNPATAFVKGTVGDRVTIASAVFDPGQDGGTLKVSASSSDSANPPTLSLEGFPEVAVVGAGTLTISPLAAPPARVRVVSTAKGVNEAQVVVSGNEVPPPPPPPNPDPDPGPAPTPPMAHADAAVAVEDEGPVSINVLGNDENAAGGSVSLVASPSKGTASVAGGSVTYTPYANAFGSDQFTYKVTVGGLVSNVATVAISIAAVNDAPVAGADSATTVAGVSIDIPVLSNDTDIDGDTLSVSSAGPSASGATISVVDGGQVRYTPAPGFSGPESFSYTVADGQGGTATGQVSVTVASPENVNVLLSEFRTGILQWNVLGTSSVLAPHSVTVKMIGGVAPCNGQVLGSATTDPAGSWVLRVTANTPSLDPRNGGCTGISAQSSLGGSDPSTPTTIRR
jgi:hypothetical protein